MLQNNDIGGPSGIVTGKREGAWSWAAPLTFVLPALAVVLAGCVQSQLPNQAQQQPATGNAAGATTATLAAALPAPPPAEFNRPPVIPASLPAGAGGQLKLAGLDRTSVIEALGRPRLARREAAAEVLTFSSLDCSLFVFLYDGPDGVGVVRHVEARARRGFALVSESRCVDSVLGRKATAPANPV